MTFLRNVLLASGVCVFTYVMLKVFLSNSNRTSKKDSNIDECDKLSQEKIGETSEESTQPEINIVENKPMKNLKQKPNFFLAFQVNNVGIHTRVKDLQKNLIAKNPTLFPALIKVATLHVTLAVTHLANETDIKTIKSKLDDWAEKNVNRFFGEPCILSFTGVKTFNNIVAYINLDQCSNFKKISEISKSFNALLSSSGFLVDKRSFTPHLTFLKLSKDIKLLKQRKKFKDDFESLKQCQEHFGTQEVTSIQLLSMDDPKDELGYFKCYHEIKVSDVQLSMDHSECCSPVKKPKSLAKEQIKKVIQGLKEKK